MNQSMNPSINLKEPDESEAAGRNQGRASRDADRDNTERPGVSRSLEHVYSTGGSNGHIGSHPDAHAVNSRGFNNDTSLQTLSNTCNASNNNGGAGEVSACHVPEALSTCTIPYPQTPESFLPHDGCRCILSKPPGYHPQPCGTPSLGQSDSSTANNKTHHTSILSNNTLPGAAQNGGSNARVTEHSKRSEGAQQGDADDDMVDISAVTPSSSASVSTTSQKVHDTMQNPQYRKSPQKHSHSSLSSTNSSPGIFNSVPFRITPTLAGLGAYQKNTASVAGPRDVSVPTATTNTPIRPAVKTKSKFRYIWEGKGYQKVIAQTDSPSTGAASNTTSPMTVRKRKVQPQKSNRVVYSNDAKATEKSAHTTQTSCGSSRGVSKDSTRCSQSINVVSDRKECQNHITPSIDYPPSSYLDTDNFFTSQSGGDDPHSSEYTRNPFRETTGELPSHAMTPYTSRGQAHGPSQFAQRYNEIIAATETPTQHSGASGENDSYQDGFQADFSEDTKRDLEDAVKRQRELARLKDLGGIAVDEEGNDGSDGGAGTSEENEWIGFVDWDDCASADHMFDEN